ncbi:MAG: hypothetical protein ACJASX_004331 [Limisphaerales bacterium]|jgi:hypothetical protein
MNDDDFESTLRQLPPRKALEHWRATILDEATSAPPRTERRPERGTYSLLQLCLHALQRNPAWSGFVGIWLVSALLQISTPRIDDGAVVKISESKAASPQAFMLVWEMHIRQETDRSTTTHATVADPKRSPATRPRSRLRALEAFA